MTLNVNEPSDQALVAELPSYIREDRIAINSISGEDNIGTTTLAVAAGTTTLVVGTDLGNYGFETVIISGAAAIALANMTGGSSGQVKVFIFQDNNLILTDGAKANGNFFLNQLPALSNFNAQQDDILALVNIGGDGATIPGYWKELWRQISVK